MPAASWRQDHHHKRAYHGPRSSRSPWHEREFDVEEGSPCAPRTQAPTPTPRTTDRSVAELPRATPVTGLLALQRGRQHGRTRAIHAQRQGHDADSPGGRAASNSHEEDAEGTELHATHTAARAGNHMRTAHGISGPGVGPAGGCCPPRDGRRRRNRPSGAGAAHVRPGERGRDPHGRRGMEKKPWPTATVESPSTSPASAARPSTSSASSPLRPVPAGGLATPWRMSSSNCGGPKTRTWPSAATGTRSSWRSVRAPATSLRVTSVSTPWPTPWRARSTPASGVSRPPTSPRAFRRSGITTWRTAGGGCSKPTTRSSACSVARCSPRRMSETRASTSSATAQRRHPDGRGTAPERRGAAGEVRGNVGPGQQLPGETVRIQGLMIRPVDAGRAPAASAPGDHHAGDEPGSWV